MARKRVRKLSYRLREIPVSKIHVWKEAQARGLDRQGLKDLVKSIRNEGLQNPPMVQRNGKGTYLLMSGQRRLAALKRLRVRKIPVLVLAKGFEIEDAKAASVTENIHRRNMNAKDMAKSCAFLAETMGKMKGAQSLGMSLSTFKKYLGFAGVPDKLKDLVPSKITRDNAVRLNQIVPNVSKAITIANRISKYDNPTRRRYLDALAENPSAPHKKILSKAKKLRIKQRVSVGLSRRQARGLARESYYDDLEPEELAVKIVSSWLTRRGYKN